MRILSFAGVVLITIMLSTGANQAAAVPPVGGWTVTVSSPAGFTDHTAVLLPTGMVTHIGGEGASGASLSAFTYRHLLFHTQSWSTSMGPMSEARVRPAAVLLRSGRVLVLGPTSAQLYNYNTTMFEPAAAPPPGIDYTSATLLADGRVLAAGGAPHAASTQAAIYDPISNAWAMTGSLSQGRSDHSLTRLRDGRVLAIGGADGAGVPLASAEIFDPVAGTWSAGPALGEARTDHVATQLLDGSVLIVGGEAGGGGLRASAELYNATASIVAGAGSLATARVDFAASLLPNGDVLVSGGTTDIGSGTTTASAEVYDHVHNEWVSAGDMSVARSGHSSMLLRDGSVLIAGGATTPNVPPYVASAELYWPNWRVIAPPVGLGSPGVTIAGGRVLYAQSPSSIVFDPATNSFSNAAAPPTWAWTGVGLNDGRALLMLEEGGNVRAHLYDPATDTWTPTDGVFARRRTPPLLLADGRVFHVDADLDSVFDPVTDTWTFAGSPPNFYDPVLALLPDGKVLQAGGHTVQTFPYQIIPVKKVLIYDPVADAWSNGPDMNFARDNHTATVLPDGRVLVVSDGSAEVYDQTTNTWSVTGPLNDPHVNHAAALMDDGRVVVMGGSRYFGRLSHTEIYDPATNQWTPAVAPAERGTSSSEPLLITLADGRIANFSTITAPSGKEILDTHLEASSPDADGDRYIDAFEMAMGRDPSVLCKTMRADNDESGVVSSIDLQRVAITFGWFPAAKSYDQNGDRRITAIDLSQVAQRFGTTVASCP